MDKQQNGTADSGFGGGSGGGFGGGGFNVEGGFGSGATDQNTNSVRFLIFLLNAKLIFLIFRDSAVEEDLAVEADAEDQER